MTKRVLAMLLALVMVIACLPVAVLAEPAEQEQAPLAAHEDALHLCEHCASETAPTWTAWDGTAALEDGGHYVLSGDVTLSAPIALSSGSYVICLNGKTVTGSTTIFDLSGTASVTLVDCTAKTEENVYTAGVLTGATTSAVRAADTAAFTMYDGIFTGNTNTATVNTEGGGAINAFGNSVVTLLGGELRGNTAGKYGGALFARNYAKLHLQNVTVTGNETQLAGAIYGTGAVEYTITDSVITGNVSTNTSTAGYGAAVYMSGSALKLTVSGKTVIAGNTVGNAKVADLVLALAASDTLYVNGLTEGSNIVFGTPKTAVTSANLSDVIAVAGEQTGWSSHWVTFMHMAGTSAGATEAVSMKSDGTFLFGHYHGDQLYTAITDNVGMKNAEGYCYLTKDLNLGGEQTRGKDLNLCLNGHTIKAKAGKRIFTTDDKTPITFTIEDCTAYTDENGVYHAGMLTGGQNTASGGGAIYLDAGNTLNLVDGKICGNTSTVIGGAILAYGTINISGGEISGNSTVDADGLYKNGGAITLNKGSQLHMTGGVIKDNLSRNGGAIYAGMTTIEITGGKITGNEAREKGGAIYSTGTSQITVTGGEISGNCAGVLAGGVYWAEGEGKLNLSGEPVIADNAVGGKLNNLYLDGNAMLTVGEMGEKANVGISAAAAQRAISAQLTADCSAKFPGDNQYYQVIFQDNALYLAVISDHQHCLCGAQELGCDHSNVDYIPWEATDSLPTAGNYYLTKDVQLTGETGITGDLNLCLNGFTVTAAAEKRLLSTPANAGLTVAISDCSATTVQGVYTAGKLTGGQDISTAGGGAIFLRPGNTLKLYDGIITENTSVVAGGAIATGKDSVFEIYGGEISNNKLVGNGKNGGAIFLNVDAKFNMAGGTICGNESVAGAGIYVNKAVANITGGSVANNKANTGAGIQVTTDGTLNLSGGEISGNQTTSNGGGIYIATGGKLNMTGGSVKNNTSATNGGGIYMLKLEVTFEGGEVADNKAETGGGIYFNGTTVNLKKITVSGNKAVQGGGIYGRTVTSANAETGESEQFPFIINLTEGAVIKGNVTEKNGGGMMVAGENAQLTMTGGSVTENRSIKNAGGILIISGASMKLSGGSVSYNSAHSGGGIYVATRCRMDMNGGYVAGNSATSSGGSFYLLGAKSVNFNAGTITGSKAVQGAGVYVAGSTVNLNGTTITGNTAEKNGGGMMVTISTVTSGGVKTRYNSDVTMNGGVITENAGINAGGVLVQSTGSVFNLKGGKITNNTASSSGAGIYISTNGTLNMSGGEVSGNVATNNAGGINNYKCKATYTGGVIANNKAATGGGMTVGGGTTCEVTIEKLTVSGNSAERAGGGILVQGNSKLHVGAAEILNNVSGKIGGGICISSKTHVTMDGTILKGNTAKTEAGGVYVYTASSAVINNATFEENHAVNTGGGIFSRGRLILTNSVVKNNTCDGDGGGIGTYRVGTNRIGTSSYMTVENTTVEGNTCNGKGAGIYLSLGHPGELKNVTITGNASVMEGGAVWSGCSLSMEGINVTGNTSGGEGFAVYLLESDYDGESFTRGARKMRGDVIVRDNLGGDLYLGERSVISITADDLGENTYIHMTLASGLLTRQLLGTYNYEGGDGDYIVTYGTRSMTEPEREKTEESQPTEPSDATEPTEAPIAQKDGNGGLIAGAIAIFVALIAAATAVIVLKNRKKKSQE